MGNLTGRKTVKEAVHYRTIPHFRRHEHSPLGMEQLDLVVVRLFQLFLVLLLRFNHVLTLLLKGLAVTT